MLIILLTGGDHRDEPPRNQVTSSPPGAACGAAPPIYPTEGLPSAFETYCSPTVALRIGLVIISSLKSSSLSLYFRGFFFIQMSHFSKAAFRSPSSGYPYADRSLKPYSFSFWPDI